MVHVPVEGECSHAATPSTPESQDWIGTMHTEVANIGADGHLVLTREHEIGIRLGDLGSAPVIDDLDSRKHSAHPVDDAYGHGVLAPADYVGPGDGPVLDHHARRLAAALDGATGQAEEEHLARWALDRPAPVHTARIHEAQHQPGAVVRIQQLAARGVPDLQPCAHALPPFQAGCDVYQPHRRSPAIGC